MKRFLSLLCFSWLLGGALSAQAVETSVLRGRVWSGVDSTALSGATVTIAGETPINTTSNAAGYFELKEVPYGNHEIQFVLLGYNRTTLPVTVGEPIVQLKDIYLNESTSTIEEVVVNVSAPIAVIKSDTVQYNADAFKTNPDADVEELIVKMPGIVIQQGKIEAQGEPVKRIYVDGKLFFGTDPMAALKSLPADAVESIQLFDAPSEESRLTGFDDGNTEKAINIVTKAKSRKITIIKAEAAGGASTSGDESLLSRYLAGGNFSRFVPGQRLTVSMLTNNVNTRRFGEPEAGGGDVELDANGNIKNLPLGMQNVKGAGVNYSYEKENKLKVEASYFFDQTKSYIISHTENNFYPDKKFTQKATTTDNSYFSNSANHRFNTRVEWKPDKANTLVFAPSMTYRTYGLDPRGSYVVTIQENDSTNRYRTYSPSNNGYLTVAGDLLWTHRFCKPGRALTASFTASLADNDLDQYQVDSLRQNWNKKKAAWVDVAPDKLMNRNIHQSSATNSIRGKLIWTEPLSLRNRLLLSYTYSREWSNFDKEGNDYDRDAETYTNLDPKISNRYSRDYTTNSAGLGYSYYSPQVAINTTLDIQRADREHVEDIPNQVRTYRTYFDLQPMVSLKYTLAKKRYLRFQYRGRSVLPNIQLMQDVLNTTRPAFLVQGNPNLKEGYSHTLEAFYNTADTKHSTNLTITLRGTATSNYVTTQNRILSDSTDLPIPYIPSNPNSEKYLADINALLSKPLNMNGYATASASATYSFTLRPIKSNINLSLLYSYTNTPSYYQDLANISRNNSIGGRIGITSNISRNVDFNIYSTTTFNDTYNTTRENDQYLNQNLYYSINIIFWKGIVFNSVLSWRYYHSSTAPNMNMSYYVLNASLGKKVFKSQLGEVRFSVYDLLNQNVNRLHYVRDAYVQDVQSNTLGRYMMLRFSYRFNSLTQRKGTVDVKNAQKIGVKTLQKISDRQQDHPSGSGKSATPKP